MTADVRMATAADLAAMSALQQHAYGSSPPDMGQALARGLAAEDTWLWVAATGEAGVVGFARLRLFELEGPPPGAYLAGLIVHPDHRGKGIAGQLIRARIDFAREAGHDTVYYFANARNLASIRLHARFGFGECQRPFAFPGVSFEGGEGVLFRLDTLG